METKVSGRKSGRISDLMFMATLLLLTDYLRFRFHDWGKLSNPLSGALGFLVSSTVAFLIWGQGRLTKRTALFLALLGSLAIYLVGISFHF
jgi:hypothetical protein